MNKFSDLLSVQANKPPRFHSRKRVVKKKLPRIRQHKSTTNLKQIPLQKSNMHNKRNSFEVSKVEEVSFQAHKIRANSSAEEDFNKLERISQRNLHMWNQNLHINQRLIEISSGHLSFPKCSINKNLSISLFHKYHTKQKLNLLPSINSIFN